MCEISNIFQEALKNFTFDVACGGAIGHLAERGYVPQEIQRMLDFPVPYGQVQEGFWNYLRKQKIILEEATEIANSRERVRFVTEYDDYGRKSFRRVVENGEAPGTGDDVKKFRNVSYDPGVHGVFAVFLKEYCGGQGERAAYVSCDFGLRMAKDPEEYRAFLEPLTDRQRLYLEGIPWKRKMVWHQLNQPMREILGVLYERSSYHGKLLLPDKGEQVVF